MPHTEPRHGHSTQDQRLVQQCRHMLGLEVAVQAHGPDRVCASEEVGSCLRGTVSSLTSLSNAVLAPAIATPLSGVRAPAVQLTTCFCYVSSDAPVGGAASTRLKNVSSSSIEWKCVAWADRTCSTRPMSWPCATSASVCSFTTKARWRGSDRALSPGDCTSPPRLVMLCISGSALRPASPHGAGSPDNPCAA